MRSILSCPCRDQRDEQGSSPRLHCACKIPGPSAAFPIDLGIPSTQWKRSMDKPCGEKFDMCLSRAGAFLISIEAVDSHAWKDFFLFSSRSMLKRATQEFDFCMASTGGRRGYLIEK